eukprot:scaffold83722_cov69-Phaeocystis_antarctica.AAC.3
MALGGKGPWPTEAIAATSAAGFRHPGAHAYRTTPSPFSRRRALKTLGKTQHGTTAKGLPGLRLRLDRKRLAQPQCRVYYRLGYLVRMHRSEQRAVREQRALLLALRVEALAQVAPQSTPRQSRREPPLLPAATSNVDNARVGAQQLRAEDIDEPRREQAVPLALGLVVLWVLLVFAVLDLKPPHLKTAPADPIYNGVPVTRGLARGGDLWPDSPVVLVCVERASDDPRSVGAIWTTRLGRLAGPLHSCNFDH